MSVETLPSMNLETTFLTRVRDVVKKFAEENKEALLPEERIHAFVEQAIKNLFDPNTTTTITYERSSYNNNTQGKMQCNPITAVVMSEVLPIFKAVINEKINTSESELRKRIIAWIDDSTTDGTKAIMEDSFERLAKGSLNVVMGTLFLNMSGLSKSMMHNAINSGLGVTTSLTPAEMSSLSDLAVGNNVNADGGLFKAILKQSH